MPRSPWRCGRCATLNLSEAESCRRCGARPGTGATSPRRGRRDDAGLAAALSLFVPGLGQLYTSRPRRAAALFGVPIAILVVVAAVLIILGPLMALALRVAAGIAAAVVATVACYHAFVILDAFAAPSTAGLGVLRKPRRDYAVLAAVAAVFLVAYVTLFRQSTAWATLAQRVFEPFGGASLDTAATWTGHDRLNVLLMGVDTRQNGDESANENTDTMIVLTLDPLNKTAGMLSIPRDTLVPIPGHNEDKINAAFAYGGPDLAKRTVSQFLGVPINGYAIVDFTGFRRIVEALGGVVVDAPLPVRDEAYPTEDYGVTRLDIRAGPQLMDGETALRYARSRHESNDFSRAERQQRVITAVKRRAGETDMLLRLPSLVDELSGAVRTDLDPGNLLPLLRLGIALKTEDIERYVLMPPSDRGPGELRESTAGGYYLIPERAAIDAVVSRFFYDPQVRAEAARVEVRASRSATAQDVADELSARRYQVVRTMTTGTQSRTLVLLRNPAKRYSAEQLAKALGATVSESSVESDADLVVMLGDDFRGLSATAR